MWYKLVSDILTLFRWWLEPEQQLCQHQHRQDRVRLSQPLGLQLEEEQWQEAVVEVAGGRPLEEEDKHPAQLVLGRWLLHQLRKY